jgi:hypothetical protein
MTRQSLGQKDLQGLELLDHQRHMVARLAQYSEVNPVCGLAPKRTCMEPYIHGDLALCAQITCDGGIKSEPCDFYLTCGVPAVDPFELVLLDQGPVELNIDLSGLGDGKHRGDLSMLVGVREAVDVPEGVLSRVWLQVVWLQLLNEPQTMFDPLERPAAYRRADGPDAGLVDLLIPIDRELMLVGEGSVAGFCKFRDDVIERTAEVVYHVTKDDPQAWFADVLRDQKDIAPAGLWIDLGKPGGVRTVLFNLDLQLSLKSATVIHRPCDLCLCAGEIESHTASGTVSADRIRAHESCERIVRSA